LGHIGTYVRTQAIDNLVDKFLSHELSQKKQIISLGAGSDTRFFRLMSAHPRANGIGYERPNLIYHEIDFPANTIEKINPIKKLSELIRHVEPPLRLYDSSGQRGLDNEDTIDADNYHVHPIDLRTLDHSRPPPQSFEYIEKDLPTLIVSECCLCYLAPAAADAVALYFTQHFFPSTTPLGLVLYEPIKPNDSFGKVMVSNLAARGIVLQTLRKYGSLEAQAARMKAYGFEGSGGADVNELWNKGVDEKEKERVARLEMVDEVEEWELLAGHYCVAWGWRGEGWDGWQDVARQFSDK
jgi:[phosphatase 2A protein]-leucine-carboxy methyltransferase